MPYDELGNYYDDGSSGDNSVAPVAPDTTETEEERKKRLAAEQAATNPTPTFTDNFKNYMGSQLGLKMPTAGGTFTQNFNTMMGQPQTENTPPAAAPAPVEPNDVVHKQQIVTRADGSQTHTTTAEFPASSQQPTATSYPVAPQTQIQAQPLPPVQGGNNGYVNLANSAGPNVAYQQPEQQVIQGPANPTPGAGRGQVNPPTVNAPQQVATGGLINNNPGNIMYGPYAQSMGATGARPNGTAIFPDQTTGENAQNKLLASPGYANLSIKDIPKRWAPAGHGNNNPVAYGESLQKITGFDDATMSKKYNELTPGEQAVYRQAMAKIEHGSNSTGILPNKGIAAFQAEVSARDPQALGGYGINGNMGPNTKQAVANNPDLAQKYGLTASGEQANENMTPVQRGINAYSSAQKDPGALLKLSQDDNMPEFIRSRSRQQAYELLHQDRQINDANTKAQQLIGAGDQTAIAKAMASKPKDEAGSYFKAAIFAHLGLTDLAREEQQKLGAGQQWKPAMSAQGETGLVKFDGQGLPMEGIKADGSAMDSKDLANYASGAAIAQQNKTLQTQAHHSAATAMDGMRKENLAAMNKGLAPTYTEEQIMQRGRDVYNQTMQIRPGGIPIAGVTGTAGTNQTTQGQAPQVAGGTQPTTVEGEQVPTSKGGILGDWKTRRVGEDVKAYSKRMEIRPEDVEEAAQQLVRGDVKPSEFTGRGSDFRRLAIIRAGELDKDYSPMRYDLVKDTVKKYTSGKDHDTLVNIGTAGNHLLQFKDAANTLPQGQKSDVSSWNTFAQKMSKYFNAPELKSKEAMAEFVAGEMVKAATGGQGSMSERQSLEKKLLAANTPAEWNAVVDSQLKLAHGRYDSMRKSYEASTKRKDFNDIIGMPDEVAKEFSRIEGQTAATSGYKDKDKEARYQEWKRKQGQQ